MSSYEREQRMTAALSVDQTARQHADTLRGWERWLALVGQAYGDSTDIATVARSAAAQCERLSTALRYLSDAAARETDLASRSLVEDQEQP